MCSMLKSIQNLDWSAQLFSLNYLSFLVISNAVNFLYAELLRNCLSVEVDLHYLLSRDVYISLPKSLPCLQFLDSWRNKLHRCLNSDEKEANRRYFTFEDRLIGITTVVSHKFNVRFDAI